MSNADFLMIIFGIVYILLICGLTQYWKNNIKQKRVYDLLKKLEVMKK